MGPISANSLIDAEEKKAEKIVSLVQLSALILIFIIYLLSPKGFSSSSFQPVEIVFSIYIPILFFRLLLASTEKLSSAILYFLLLCDLFLLTALIWSYHIQYESLVTLSLRSPTFLYYFVFLAVRCLSYNYKQALFILFCINIFWSFIVFTAIHSDEIQISSRYAEYLNPNTVLLGIEIDKLIALNLAGLFICYALYRKSVLLKKFAIISKKEAVFEKLIGKKSLSTFDLDKEEFKPGHGIRRKAVSLMVDLRGFSQLSYQIETDLILSHLAKYQKIVAEVIFDNNGSIDKYLGDGVLAHFGAVAIDPAYAASSLKAAEQLFHRLESWRKETVMKSNLNINFGIAMAVGEVIFGVIGHEERMEITTLGESVNLSAKLEKHTKSTESRVLTTKELLDLAIKQGYRPTSTIKSYPKTKIDGIPHEIDLIGLDFN